MINNQGEGSKRRKKNKVIIIKLENKCDCFGLSSLKQQLKFNAFCN